MSDTNSASFSASLSAAMKNAGIASAAATASCAPAKTNGAS
jgi:hypothetical protein